MKDISTLIETEALHVYDKKASINLKILSVLLLLIGMIIGGVVWATNSHASIRDWTSEQDFVTKTELKDVMRERYVKVEDFAIVKQKLENLDEKHKMLIKILDKIDGKIDRLERGVRKRTRR